MDSNQLKHVEIKDQIHQLSDTTKYQWNFMCNQPRIFNPHGISKAEECHLTLQPNSNLIPETSYPDRDTPGFPSIKLGHDHFLSRLSKAIIY